MERILVTTSAELGQPLLEVSATPFSREDQLIPTGPLIYLRLFRLVMIDDEGEKFRSIEEGKLIWRPEESFQQVVDRMLDTYMRLNLPKEGLAVEVAIASLMLNYGLMFNAMQEPEGSPKRLIGRLLFAINDEWVLTDAGLEGTKSDHFYGWYDDDGRRYDYLRYPDDLCPSGCSPDLWEEAKCFAWRLNP